MSEQTEQETAEAEHAATIAALRQALVDVARELPEVETGYGHFPGDDPRLFWPDPECSTAEEREAHKAACARWAAGDTEPKAPYEHGPHGPDGPVPPVYVTYCGFGLGTYRLPSQTREYVESILADPSAAGRAWIAERDAREAALVDALRQAAEQLDLFAAFCSPSPLTADGMKLRDAARALLADLPAGARAYANRPCVYCGKVQSEG
jgi:hypothetical protein